MVCALLYTRRPLAHSVRYAPGLICQGSARSAPQEKKAPLLRQSVR
jgi:hypothetical protein